MEPIEAAEAFLHAHFPDCLAAFAAGSWHRGEATPTSDIDLVLVTTGQEAPIRASYHEHGWPIEAFVHTTRSYRRYFASDCASYTPSLPFMCVEGTILRDRDGWAQRVRIEAQALLDAGPTPLPEEQLASRRYALTDLLDDLTGCDRPEEGYFIAAALATEATELLLLQRRQWLGRGKWTYRALRRFDPDLAETLAAALQAYYVDGSKSDLMAFTEMSLQAAGGRLFAGYSASGPPDEALG